MSTMMSKTISQYHILEKPDGMGVVYEAEDLKLHRHVALHWIEELKQKSPSEKM
jgi:hypothetical protein